MSEIKGIVFDLDGCLYPFDRGSGNTFSGSEFGQSIKQQELVFIQQNLRVDFRAAQIISKDLKERYNRHLSLGLEYEYGIPREDFFSATWDLAPSEYIDEQPGLAPILGSLTVDTALLTAAPKIWADRVIDYLGLAGHFTTNVRCGDEDIRKPDPRAFEQIADMLETPPAQIVSIGDQEHTDIIPAKSIGMMTMLIGERPSSADFVAKDIDTALNHLKNVGIL